MTSEQGQEQEQRHADPPASRPQRFWWHAAGLAAVLLLLLPLLDDGPGAVPDEGVYLSQAQALSEGSWWSPRPAPDVDEIGYFDPRAPEAVKADRAVPYARHALYPLLILGPFQLGERTGPLLLSVLGTWAAATVAALIARRLARQLTLWALWVAGVGSPLLFYAYVTTAHSMAAALTGILFLGIAQFVEDRRSLTLIWALPAAVLLVALRSEGFIAALAIAVATVATGIMGRESTCTLRRSLVGGGMTAVLAAATYLADNWISESITGRARVGTAVGGYVTRETAGRLSGTWASLLRPFSGSWANAGYAVPIGATALILAAVTLRAMPRRELMPLVLLGISGAAGCALLFQPPGLVTGLLAAFPLLPAGLLWVKRSDLSEPIVARAAMTGAFTTLGIVATIYGVGGASEWGGRFFLVLLPILVPLALLGLEHARLHFSPRQGFFATCCLILLTAALSVSSIRAISDAQSRAEGFISGSKDYAQSAVEDDTPLVLVALVGADGAGRYFWATEGVDVLTAYGLTNLQRVLELVNESGRDRLVVVTDIPPLVFAAAFGPALAEVRWGIIDSETSLNWTFVTIERGSTDS